MNGPYRVEEDDAGCSDCGHGKTWCVIGPDEVASSTSYGDLEEAESLKQALDAAYELGRARASIGVTWTRFSQESLPPEHTYLLVWDAQYSCLATMYCSNPQEELERARKFQYSHWMLTSVLQGPPSSELPQPRVAVQLPPVVSSDPPPVLSSDEYDSILF